MILTIPMVIDHGNCNNYLTIPMVHGICNNYLTIPMVKTKIIVILTITISSIGLYLLYSTVGFNLCLRNKKSMPNGLPEIGLT